MTQSLRSRRRAVRFGLRRRKFDQLDHHVVGRCGIEEGDARVGMAKPRRLVDQLYALALEFGQCRLDVLHLQANVKQPFAVLGDPLGGLGLCAIGFEQLDVALPDRKHRQLGVVLRQLFLVFQSQTQLVLENRARLGQAFDGDCHVFDALDLHWGAPAHSFSFLLIPLLRLARRRAGPLQHGLALQRRRSHTAVSWKPAPPFGGTGSSPIKMLIARFSANAAAGQMPSTISVASCWPASSVAGTTTEPRSLPIRTGAPSLTPSRLAALGCRRRRGPPSLAIELGVCEKVLLRKWRAGGQTSL